MAYAQLNGGLLWPPAWCLPTNVSFGTRLMDATGEKIAFIGQVWMPTRGTKSVRRVQFLFGTVVKAGGSALTLSLQDVDAANGPVCRPDGTQDETVAIANADASFASNTWYRSGTFSADRSVTHGDWLAVVLEFDGGGRLGADSVQVSSLTNIGNLGFGNNRSDSAIVQFDTSWGTATAAAGVLLEFSDGTFGTLGGAVATSVNGAAAFKSDTAGADEYALRFQVPFNCKVDGVWFAGQVAAGTSDFDVVLYDGTSAMSGGTFSVDANKLRGAASNTSFFFEFAQEIALTADHTYYAAIKPTQTTSTVTVNYFDVNDNAHLVTHGGIQNYLATRVDAGSWDESATTRRPLIGVRISSIELSGGSAGGLLRHPGMTGGFNG